MITIKNLRESIEDAGLHKQIDELWRFAEATYHPFQEGDSNQGVLHCTTVEKNLSYLLTESGKMDNFNDTELFLLSAAASLHDIGKIVNPDKIPIGDPYLQTETDHGKRSGYIIREHYALLGLTRPQSTVVAKIAEFHSKGKLQDLRDSKSTVTVGAIDTERLAVVFRLADNLETTSQRTPEIVGAIRHSPDDPPAKWKGRQAISGWYIENKKIIICAEPKPEEKTDVREAFRLLKEEIDSYRTGLLMKGFPGDVELHIDPGYLKHEFLKKKPDYAFPGMGYYEEDDALIFKGRDIEREKLIEIILCHPISLLTGESGSGKTSLIRAGLFVELIPYKFRCIYIRPSTLRSSPLDEMKKRILIEVCGEEYPYDGMSLLQVIRNASARCRPQQVLIVFDQFEDILDSLAPDSSDELITTLLSVQIQKPDTDIRILISFREDFFIKIDSGILKAVTGSDRPLPYVGLERLSRTSAKDALLAGLERAGKKFETNAGKEPLLEIILDDLVKPSGRVFPPYLQIVADTLVNKSDPKNPLITYEFFYHLGGTDKIISNYLINQLSVFGPEQTDAEKILKLFVSSTGKKIVRNFSELQGLVKTEPESIRKLLKGMIDRRIIRELGNDDYEIIHDYLATIIDKQLITNHEEREIKYLQEQLQSYIIQFSKHGTPITSLPFLAALYRFRKSIVIGEEHYPVLFITSIMGSKGLGWYWLKDLGKDKILRLVEANFARESVELKCGLISLISYETSPGFRSVIHGALNDRNPQVRVAAINAFRNFITETDKGIIRRLIADADLQVKIAAIELFRGIAAPADLPFIVDMLDSRNPDLRIAAIGVYVRIAHEKDRKTVLRDLFFSGNPKVQSAIIEALVQNGDGNDKVIIVSLLESQDDQTQVLILEAIQRSIREDTVGYVREILFNSPDDGKHLILKLLKRNNGSIREAAKEIFDRIADERDRNLILKMMKDKSRLLKDPAFTKWAEIATVHDRSQIYSLLESSVPLQRAVAETAFITIVSPEDRGKILELVQSDNHHKRVIGVKAFSMIAEPDDTEMLLKLINDRNPFVRKAVLESLVKIAPGQYREFILELLKDESPSTQMVVLENLGTIASEKERSLIIGLMKHEDPKIHASLFSLITKIAPDEGREKIFDAIAHAAEGMSPENQRAFQFLSRLDLLSYSPFPSEI